MTFTDDVQGHADDERKIAALRKQVAAQSTELVGLRSVLGIKEGYAAANPVPPKWAKPKKRHKKHASTAMLLFSDQHFDEVVDPAEVNGHNAYNRDIATLRCKRFFTKACEQADRLVDHEWEGCVLFSLGDMFSGIIHEELTETNEDTMQGSLLYWVPQIAAGVRMLADYFGKVHFVQVVGNHGRMGKKPRSKKRARDNWDWLAAQLVQSHFTEDDRITWDISSGADAVTPVYGTNIVATHGDRVSGGQGIGGIWPPMMRMVHKTRSAYAAQGINVDAVVLGHWHQLVLAPTQGFAVNGSSKGWDEYAATHSFPPEPPAQGFLVCTPEYGITLTAPLFVADRKAEGW